MRKVWGTPCLRQAGRAQQVSPWDSHASRARAVQHTARRPNPSPSNRGQAVQDTVPYKQALLGPLESLVWLTWGPLEVPLVTKTKRTRELQSGN